MRENEMVHTAVATDWALRSRREEMMKRTKYPGNPLPCGCRAVGTIDLDPFDYSRVHCKSIHVRFCPLHQAAGEILKALKAIIQLLYYDKEAGHFALAHPDNFPTIDEDALMNARAAIAKAGG